MAIHHELYAAAERRRTAKGGFFAQWARNMASHDWVVLGAAVVIFCVVLRAPHAVAKARCLEYSSAVAGLTTLVMLAVRGQLLKRSPVTILLYRLTLMGATLLTYFSLATVLPVVNTNALDHRLYHLDVTIFGFEPAVYMDRFVTPFTTEWFAFFYFCYFFLLSVHVLPIVFVWKRLSRCAEFALAILTAFSVSHIVYMMVPGFGPWKALPELFHHELPSGTWYDITMDTVVAAGAMKDIFPSLHTAAPTIIALYSFRYRHEFPFKYTWIPVTFVTANIVVATMFLRWHYVIDVVFGFGLAIGASSLAAWLVPREVRWREKRGLPHSWPSLFEATTTRERLSAVGRQPSVIGR